VHELEKFLASLTIHRRDGVFVYVSAAAAIPGAAATIIEDEGITSIVERAAADAAGLPWSFASAWLTVEAQTALEGIGVTAALASALARAAIPGNVLAGFHHDHVLVPADRADDAIAALQTLRSQTSS